MLRVVWWCKAALLLVVVVQGVLAASASGAHAKRLRLTDWSTLENKRFGFLIAYPGNIFTPREAVADQPEGNVLVSRDGTARLIVAAFENETNASLAEYREQLLVENYAGAAIDYSPLKKKWFVLSGTRGDMHFYERVSFTCGGKLINSWALLYPSNERRTYDRVVDAIARTYTPGAGRTGACD
jgi:hypothetical protein